ncbi:MAG TPA: hypothetical protein VFM18_01815 [Methanosarcina sp.]|nr:hypothetical protein [Methanosarcina sp.]
MALPIKTTPVLKGKDAKSFSDKIKQNKNNPISKKNYDKIINSTKNVIFKNS